MNTPAPFSPGEYPGRPNVDPVLLDPQLLFNQYLDAAAGMPAGGRAEHLTDFAVTVRDVDPDTYEHTMAIAKDALREAWENPETADETIDGPLGVATYMARHTLDEGLIAQARERERDGLFVELAVKRRDPTIVPDNQTSRDDYLHSMATTYGNTESIPEIVDPTTRALAYKEVFGALDIDTYGPAEWLALEEEAWRSITAMPADKYGSHKRHIVAFAVEHGTTFMERIADPDLRHEAYRKFASKVGIGDEHAPDREWLKQKLIEEAPHVRGDDPEALQRIVTSIAVVGRDFADPEFVDYMLPGLLLFETKPRVMAVAIKQKALRDLDGEAALALPKDDLVHEGRDEILYRIASKTLDSTLAEKIPDEYYRMKAYSVIAGQTQDTELKETVIAFTLEGLEAENDYSENWGVAEFVINLNDPQISRRLLTTPNVTSATIARVARQTNDIELALAIPEPRLRAAALTELAGKLLRPDLLDVEGTDINPTMRANALRTMHRTVTGTVAAG